MTDTATYTIQREDKGSRGRYVIYLGDGKEAEMTYGRAGDIMTIDHTGVPPEFRGAGLAQMLVERGIADARAEGFRIEPLCSYVAAQFRRHADWADLRA